MGQFKDVMTSAARLALNEVADSRNPYQSVPERGYKSHVEIEVLDGLDLPSGVQVTELDVSQSKDEHPLYLTIEVPNDQVRSHDLATFIREEVSDLSSVRIDYDVSWDPDEYMAESSFPNLSGAEFYVDTQTFEPRHDLAGKDRMLFPHTLGLGHRTEIEAGRFFVSLSLSGHYARNARTFIDEMNPHKVTVMVDPRDIERFTFADRDEDIPRRLRNLRERITIPSDMISSLMGDRKIPRFRIRHSDLDRIMKLTGLSLITPVDRAHYMHEEQTVGGMFGHQINVGSAQTRVIEYIKLLGLHGIAGNVRHDLLKSLIQVIRESHPDFQSRISSVSAEDKEELVGRELSLIRERFEYLSRILEHEPIDRDRLTAEQARDAEHIRSGRVEAMKSQAAGSLFGLLGQYLTDDEISGYESAADHYRVRKFLNGLGYQRKRNYKKEGYEYPIHWQTMDTLDFLEQLFEKDSGPAVELLDKLYAEPSKDPEISVSASRSKSKPGFSLPDRGRLTRMSILHPKGINQIRMRTQATGERENIAVRFGLDLASPKLFDEQDRIFERLIA